MNNDELAIFLGVFSAIMSIGGAGILSYGFHIDNIFGGFAVGCLVFIIVRKFAPKSKVLGKPTESKVLGKPKDINIIGILILVFFGIFGVLGLIFNLITLFAVKSISNIAVQLYGTGYYVFSILLSGIFSIVWLIAAIGIIKSWNWSRKLTVALSALNIVSGLATSIIGMIISLPKLSGVGVFRTSILGGVIIGLAVGLLIQGLILWYFSRADIKAYYKSIGEAN